MSSALGVVPGGAFGKSATEICSRAVMAGRSIAQTLFVLAQATKSRAPSCESAIALGCSPTATSPVMASVAGSSARTFAPPHSDTNSVAPSRESTAV